MPKPDSVFVLLALLITVAGCRGAGNYVWVNDVPADPADRDYFISPGDLVSVRVMDQDPLSSRTRVRRDGRIAMPMVGEIDVAGKRPADVRADIEARLKSFIVSPAVTVNVEEFQPVQVSIMGEVARPSIVTIDAHTGVAQALATAGGVTEFANRDRIFVVRTIPRPIRIRFTYESVSRGEGASASFVLHQGDLVVVE